MARKRPRGNPGVRFAPARGAPHAASAGILGRLGAAGDRDSRRAQLLAKLQTIEAEKAALAEKAASEAATGVAGRVDATGALARARGKGLKVKGKSTAAAPGMGKAANVAKAPKAAKAPGGGDDGAAQASRRTARPRVQSVMLSTMPGECENVRTPGMSRCVSLVFCRRLVSTMLRAPTGRPFSAPVLKLWPPEAVPRYKEIITRPMDLGTIKSRLESVYYLRQPGAANDISGSLAVSSSANDVVATSPLSSSSHPCPSLSSFPNLSGALNKVVTESVSGGSGGGGDGPDCSRVVGSGADCAPSTVPTRTSGFVFDLAAFCADVRLCFNNCLLYCPAAEPLHGTARALLDKFDTDVTNCPLPLPILPEAKKEKLRVRALSEFASNAGVSCMDVTSSALSAGSDGGDDPRPPKKPRRPRSASKSKAQKEATTAMECQEELAPELVQRAEPQNLRALKRRMEYLRQCRVRVVARENGVNDVPMTREEKARLTNRLGSIAIDKVAQLVRIISRATGQTGVADDDEIEIDLDDYNAVTLREIEGFVDSCVPKHIGGEPAKTGKAEIGSEFESVDEIEVEMATVMAELQGVKARRAAVSSSGGLWDDSSSSDGSSSDGSSGSDSSGSESESSDDEK
jgi:Bromodomain extra-terminal - transcription regulation/Bromodomain